MQSISFTGYVVKFCENTKCNHRDQRVCVNPISSDFYISPKNVFDLSKNITKGTPVVLAHDAKSKVGEIRESTVTSSGVLVRGYINDVRLLTALSAQLKIYKELYSKKMTYENYVKNIFSSISLSHNPNSLHVNHIGLVNIPGRAGTEINYKKTSSVPLTTYSNSETEFRDSISTHLVAFLRNPDRVEKLSRNNRVSFESKNPCYLQASEKPHQFKMPSYTRENLVDSLYELMNSGKKRYRDESADESHFKRRRENDTVCEDQQQPPARLNEEVIIDKLSKKFDSQFSSMNEQYDKKMLEMEETRSREMSSLTDLIKLKFATPTPPVQSSPPTIEHRVINRPIEAGAETTRPPIHIYKGREEDVQRLLMNAFKDSLVGE